MPLLCRPPSDPIGWTRSNRPFQGQFAPDSSYFLNLSIPDGSVVAYSNGGSLHQNLDGQTIAPNTGYLLQVAIDRRFDCCNGLPNMIPGIPDTPATMDIELRVGGHTGTLLAINTIDIRSIPLGRFVNYSAFSRGRRHRPPEPSPSFSIPPASRVSSITSVWTPRRSQSRLRLLWPLPRSGCSGSDALLAHGIRTAISSNLLSGAVENCLIPLYPDGSLAARG